MRTGLETEEQTLRQGVQRGTVVGSDTFGAKVAGIIGQPVTRRSRGRPRKDDRK